MQYRVTALSEAPFKHLYGKSDNELAALGAKAYISDSVNGYPCRVSLKDAVPGSRVILLNYEHQPAASPYRSRHAIFVADGAEMAPPVVSQVPAMIAGRLISVRAFDADGMMLDADICEGKGAEALFLRLLSHPNASYLHVHTARRGCYLARVEPV